VLIGLVASVVLTGVWFVSSALFGPDNSSGRFLGFATNCFRWVEAQFSRLSADVRRAVVFEQLNQTTAHGWTNDASKAFVRRSNDYLFGVFVVPLSKPGDSLRVIFKVHELKLVARFRSNLQRVVGRRAGTSYDRSYLMPNEIVAPQFRPLLHTEEDVMRRGFAT